jgi:hypothetical protein
MHANLGSKPLKLQPYGILIMVSSSIMVVSIRYQDLSLDILHTSR